MKKYYLHISYQGQKDDGNIALGDGIYPICKGSGDLYSMRKAMQKTLDTKMLPNITNITVLPKKIYKILNGGE